MSFVLVSGAPASCEWLSKVPKEGTTYWFLVYWHTLKLLEQQFESPCSVTRFSSVATTRVIGAHSVTEKISVEYASNAEVCSRKAQTARILAQAWRSIHKHNAVYARIQGCICTHMEASCAHQISLTCPPLNAFICSSRFYTWWINSSHLTIS